MINPILASSSRRRMRTPRTALLLTLYGAAVLLFGVLTAFRVFFGDTVTVFDMDTGVNGYVFMLVLQFVLLLLVTPAITAGSISGERERQTLELLLVTNTSSLRIVAGKLLESMGMMTLLIVSTLPVMSLPLLTGGITLTQILTGILFLCVTAFATLSVGMLASALFRRTVAATVVSYVSVLLIGVLTLAPLIADLSRANSFYNAVLLRSSVSVISDAGTATQDAGLTLYAFIFNPALGLYALVMDQTGWMPGNLLDLSATLDATRNYLNYKTMAWGCMGFMAAAGLALDLIAACFVRPRRVRARRREKKA